MPTSCYLAADPGLKRSYIGYTENPQRRIRQHRGEIAGGAKSTRRFNGDIDMVLVVQPFPSQKVALSFEWAWKHRKPRGRDCIQRARKLWHILRNPKPAWGAWPPPGLRVVTYSRTLYDRLRNDPRCIPLDFEEP